MLRQPLVMAIAFGFPLALLLIYHFSFGKSDEGLAAMLSSATFHDRLEHRPHPAGARVGAANSDSDGVAFRYSDQPTHRAVQDVAERPAQVGR